MRFALSVGSYFAWLLSFPVFGPALGSLAASRGADAASLAGAFLPAHALGLAAAGTFGSGYLSSGRAQAAIIAVCGLLGLALLGLPNGAWRGVMLLLGLLSAMPVISWMAVISTASSTASARAVTLRFLLVVTPRTSFLPTIVAPG
ncbi:MAG: hypothetical protein M1598_05210, partial [Actinobacteria bacterium]|nr:hypothetical protein [Actinomycetota bacterium]